MSNNNNNNNNINSTVHVCPKHGTRITNMNVSLANNRLDRISRSRTPTDYSRLTAKYSDVHRAVTSPSPFLPGKGGKGEFTTSSRVGSTLGLPSEKILMTSQKDLKDRVKSIENALGANKIFSVQKYTYKELFFQINSAAERH